MCICELCDWICVVVSLYLMCLFVYEMCLCVFVSKVVVNIAIFKVPLGRGSPLGGAHHLLCHSYCGQQLIILKNSSLKFKVLSPKSFMTSIALPDIIVNARSCSWKISGLVTLPHPGARETLVFGAGAQTGCPHHPSQQ